MKCEYCNGTLTFEAEVCPHCGRKNMHAQEHIKDMLHYQREFESTKQDIHDTTKHYSRNMVQLVVITVLVIVAVIMLFVCADAGNFRSDYMRKKADRNVAEYVALIDQYVEEENFKKLYWFCEENYIHGYEEAYSHYVPLIQGAREYTFFCDSLMHVIDSKDMDDEKDMEWVCKYLNEFYYCMDMSHYEYYRNADRKENLEALEVMERDIKRMLQSYCNFTEEELHGLKDLSDARRTVLIEEKMLNEE